MLSPVTPTDSKRLFNGHPLSGPQSLQPNDLQLLQSCSAGAALANILSSESVPVGPFIFWNVSVPPPRWLGAAIGPTNTAQNASTESVGARALLAFVLSLNLLLCSLIFE